MKIEDIMLNNCDCLDLIKSIPDSSIDLLLTDPPYGVTQNKWDIAINFDSLWPEWERVVKKNGAFIFTSTQPFTTDLIQSNRKLFRYDLVWEKSIATGFLNSNKMPLRAHETVCVFYRKLPTFNPVKNFLPTNSFKRPIKKDKGSSNYGDYTDNMEKGSKDGSRQPRSVFMVKTESEFFDSSTSGLMIHPTQKPVDLFRYLIKTYSNPGDTVLDCYFGSASSAIAAHDEKRKWIGSELSPDYFDAAVKRLQNHVAQTVLF